MKAIKTDVGHEGQVVIPREVREHLGLGSHEQVAFVITDDGSVEIHRPLADVVEALRGVAGSLDRPLSWERIEEIVREERADLLAKKLGLTPPP
ncbi:MAG: AbrB/MazE/SpoVT family DNA-binding domain-containing protein [Chloroflexia bacterium]|nr:AbrB/MazE/SpoVT family DNA-binding domain-containing protein [Chloroflexia bacterium]